jgi:hypothetical protein
MKKVLGAGVALLFASISALAAPIAGSFTVNGSVRVGPGVIDFLPVGTGQGDFIIDGQNSNLLNNGVPVFPELPPANSDGDYTGLIGDINGLPVNASINVLNFITVNGFPDLAFDLRFLNQSSSPACVGPAFTVEPCAAQPNFLITLDQTPTGVTASFGAFGVVRENGLPESVWTGIFTAQFSGQTIGSLFNAIATNGFVQTSYSGEILVQPIPEPSTYALIGAGLVGLVARRWKSKR